MAAVVVDIVVRSRWLLAPFFLGLVLALLMLLAFFLAELLQLFIRLVSMRATETEVVISLLSLIDLTLISHLVVVIVYSGYENFIEKINRDGATRWPEWMTQVSLSGLKQKLFASMMAIAGITLLKALVKLEVSVSETQVKWLVVTNLIFVTCFAVLAFTERASVRRHGGDSH